MMLCRCHKQGLCLFVLQIYSPPPSPFDLYMRYLKFLWEISQFVMFLISIDIQLTITPLYVFFSRNIVILQINFMVVGLFNCTFVDAFYFLCMIFFPSIPLFRVYLQIIHFRHLFPHGKVELGINLYKKCCM